MILPRDRQDPLIGTLPAAPNNTGSPALAGQPPPITGQGPTTPVPRTQGAPALASASPPGGTAQVGGAPLSSNQPEIPQGGAGAISQQGAGPDLDLVKDRGTPDEFWSNMLMEMGSKNALNTLGQAAYGSSFNTGQLADADPEEARRMGARVNASMSLNTQEQQDALVNDMIYRPMLATMVAENRQGVTDIPTTVERTAEMITQVEGAETEDELRANTERAMEMVEEELGEDEEIEDRDNVFQRAWGRVKEFWQRGLDDPNTPDDESQETYYVDPKTGKEVEEGTPGAEERTRDVQVTKFMGGMTRQELGMFVFQWGALMMANSEQGFGGAMGMASLGALEGHQQRQTTALASNLEERQVAAQETTAAAAMLKAEQGTPPKLTAVEDGFIYHDGDNWRYATTTETDEDGNTREVRVKPPPSSADRPYAAQAMADQLSATGFFTEEEVALLAAGQPGRGQIADAAMDAWERRLAKDIYPDGMRLSDWREKPEAERNRMRREFIDNYVEQYMSVALSGRSQGGGALTGGGGADAGRDAVDQYDTDE